MRSSCISHIIAPTAPRDFNYMNPTPTITGVALSVTLTWRRPDPPNGVITQYNVSNITQLISEYLLCNYVGVLYCYKPT